MKLFLPICIMGISLASHLVGAQRLFDQRLRTLVDQGRTIDISTTTPVRFHLWGIGSLDKSVGTRTNYTAPTHLATQHTISGCPVLPSDSIFNTPIDNLPVHWQSQEWITYVANNGVTFDPSWGIAILASSNVRMVPQEFYYTTNLNGTRFPIPPAATSKREMGSYTANGSSDHHTVVLLSDRCQFYETYQEGDNLSLCRRCTAESGYTYSSSSYAQPLDTYGGGTADAAGLPLAPLTLHLSEIQDGEVLHALRFTACLGCVSREHVWPATGSTGVNAVAPPMGSRLRLKASFDVSPYPKAAQVVLNGLKRYGMILADIGLTGDITTSTDITERPDIVRDLGTIQQAFLKSSDWDVVDESSLKINSASNQVNPANGYVIPQNQAFLTATSLSNPTQSETIPLVLVPGAIGTYDPSIVVQAGTQRFKVPAWGHGVPVEELTRSVEPSTLGSFDEDGVFTPTEHVDSAQSGLFTFTSTVDPTVKTHISFTVVPAGAINVDVGSPVPTASEDGTKWLADLGFETGAYATIRDDYPSGLWGSIPNVKQIDTFMYTWGSDITYRFHVPNGTYQITLTSAVGECSGPYDVRPGGGGLARAPLLIETQGKVAVRAWDPGSAVHHYCRVPSSITVPALVTDTNLHLAIRSTSNGDNLQTAPLLNSLSIVRIR